MRPQSSSGNLWVSRCCVASSQWHLQSAMYPRERVTCERVYVNVRASCSVPMKPRASTPSLWHMVARAVHRLRALHLCSTHNSAKASTTISRGARFALPAAPECAQCHCRSHRAAARRPAQWHGSGQCASSSASASLYSENRARATLREYSTPRERQRRTSLYTVLSSQNTDRDYSDTVQSQRHRRATCETTDEPSGQRTAVCSRAKKVKGNFCSTARELLY